MKSTLFTRHPRRLRSLAAVGTVAVLALGLAACGSDDTDANSSSVTASTTASATAATTAATDTGSTDSSAAGSTGTDDPGTDDSTAGGDDLASQVATLEQPLDSYPVPTEPIEGVDSLAGKTVYYIPITSQSPQFGVTQGTLTEAMQAVGISVQVCDGKGTPTDVSACIIQATDAGAGTIITDAIAYGLAANAFDAAQAANIPVIISNQIPADDHPASSTLAYIPGGGSDMQVALAKWVTLDSGGTAKVLINQGTDGPSPAAFVAAGTQTYTEDCPGCTITINEVSSANFSLIPSSTSSALLQNPDIGYVESQFEQYLQPTQTGVEQNGAGDAIKGVTGSAQLGGLQALASQNFLYAAAAQASAFQGWVDADAALRLMLGVELPEYTIPVRLFTRDSIADVPLTSEAETSGEWFGPSTFRNDFTTLWGIG